MLEDGGCVKDYRFLNGTLIWHKSFTAEDWTWFPDGINRSDGLLSNSGRGQINCLLSVKADWKLVSSGQKEFFYNEKASKKVLTYLNFSSFNIVVKYHMKIFPETWCLIEACLSIPPSFCRWFVSIYVA